MFHGYGTTHPVEEMLILMVAGANGLATLLISLSMADHPPLSPIGAPSAELWMMVRYVTTSTACSTLAFFPVSSIHPPFIYQICNHNFWRFLDGGCKTGFAEDEVGVLCINLACQAKDGGLCWGIVGYDVGCSHGVCLW